jgi:hypothetical protein
MTVAKLVAIMLYDKIILISTIEYKWVKGRMPFLVILTLHNVGFILYLTKYSLNDHVPTSSFLDLTW